MIPDASFPPVNGLGIDTKDPKAIAAKVQAMFLEVMLKAMEDSVGAEDGMFGGSANSEIYRGMFREQLASAISSQMGGPLAEQIEKGLSTKEENSDFGMRNADFGMKPSPKSEIRNPHSEVSLPVSGVISSERGWRKDPFTGEQRLHKGIDIAAPAGSSVNAVAAGTVIESGVKGSYGNAVVIQTDDGRRMLYAHNQQNFVRVGDRVVRGDAIAQVGSTGRATGPHVHFEVME